MDGDNERLRAHAISRGRHARDVLANPAYAEALEEVRTSLYLRFCGSAAEAHQEREKIWAIGRAVEALSDRLQAFIEVGNLEERNKADDAKR